MPPPDAPFSGQEHIDFAEHKTRLNTLPETVALDPADEVDAGTKETSTDKKDSSLDTKDASPDTKEASTYIGSFTARVPGITPPSFRSFAVTRAYRLRARIVVEMCEKKFDVDVESHIAGLYS
jgi:hypothetical protein